MEDKELAQRDWDWIAVPGGMDPMATEVRIVNLERYEEGLGWLTKPNE